MSTHLIAAIPILFAALALLVCGMGMWIYVSKLDKKSRSNGDK